MTLIEGFGNEVTILLTTIFVIIIIYLGIWIKVLLRQADSIRNNHERSTGANNDAIPAEFTHPNSENLNVTSLVESESINAVSNDESSEPAPQSESDSVEKTISNQSSFSQNHQPLLDGNSTEIRIQYVDGRQRYVIASLDDTIGNFKRENFSRELGVGEMVRLIACGRELRDEDTTLRSAGLNNNGVLHCLITATPLPNTSQQTPPQNVRGNVMGNMFVPLLFLMLSLLWYVRIAYRFIFTGFTTFLLAALTAIFLIVITISISPQLSNNPRPHQL